MTRTIAFLVFLIVGLTVSAVAQSGVKGKVKAPNGKGIPNASITVRKDGKDVKTTTSDAKGEFAISLSPGKYNIAFDANGYSMGVLHGVEVGSKVRDLGDRLILTVDRGTFVIIQGAVFFKEGSSVTGATVELAQVNADGSTKSLGSTFSNTAGEFTFRRPEGISKLRVTAKLKGSSASKEIEVEEAAIYRVAITLPMSREDR